MIEIHRQIIAREGLPKNREAPARAGGRFFWLNFFCYFFSSRKKSKVKYE